ncbi:MAG: hypothetical protein ACUVSV_03985 [Armatimonadota bacterium]
MITYRLQGTAYVEVPCEQTGEQEWRAYSEQLGLYVAVRWEDDRYRAHARAEAEARLRKPEEELKRLRGQTG